MMTMFKIILLLLLWSILFIPVYPGLFDAWISDSNNSHGLLVPLVSLYLIWQKREGLMQVELCRSWWGASLMVASLLLYILSYAGGLAVTMRLALVASLLGLAWFVLGDRPIRMLLFPLLFLLFMIPLPDSIVGTVSFPMQQFATTASAFIIQMTTIPVVQEGNMLYFVQTQLQVAEACSGLRSLLSLTMLSVLFAHGLAQPRWRKLSLVMSAIPIAVLANIVRVSGTGILAHFFGSDIAKGFLHTFSGIAVFLFGLALLALEYRLLTRFSVNRPARLVDGDKWSGV